MEWLTAIAKALGLADFLARWIHDEEVEAKGEQKHELSDLKAQEKRSVEAQVSREDVHRLSDDDLNERLRNDGAGHR